MENLISKYHLSKIWYFLTCKTVFHVIPQSAVDSIKAGISLIGNIWAQYGHGFYTFARRKDALKWKRLRPELLEISEHVILEFRIPRRVWKQLKRKKVPESYNWRVPNDWINDFDVLESFWGVTADTRLLQGAKQYKFNPHTFHILDTALVR